MEIKITKEKVLEAASKCSTEKATLEVLFPECFEQKKVHFDADKIYACISRDRSWVFFLHAYPDTKCFWVRMDRAASIYHRHFDTPEEAIKYIQREGYIVKQFTSQKEYFIWAGANCR